MVLTADAVAYVVLVYKAIELALLGLDHVVATAPALLASAGCVIGLVGAFIVQRRDRWFVSRERLWDQVLGAVTPVAIVLALFLAPARKGFSGAWIPLEWHKVPANLDLMAAIAGVETVIGTMLLLFLASGFTRQRGPWRLAAYAMLIAWAEANTVVAAQMPATHKVSGYLVAFASPPLLALVFAILGYQRWATRAVIAGALGTLIFWHYAGWLPVHTLKTPVERRTGYTRLYPEIGEPADFPLGYMRELVLSPDGRYLFTCFGPSSGIVRIDLTTAQAQIIGVHGLSRYLWQDPARGEIWTLDWDSGDLLTFSADPFARTHLSNILEGPRIAPWSFVVTPERVFVTFHEHPILAEYDRRSGQFLRQIDMKAQGFTRFNAGLLKIAHNDADGMLYVELGMTDTRDHFMLLKVDPRTLTVVEQADLPEGGLDFLLLPKKQRLLAASFFSDRLYEFQLEPLRLTRVLTGPLNSRNLAWDPKRDVLVGLAFLPGELWAIDYKTGIVLKRDIIGHKAQSLLMDPPNDRVLIGSDVGVHAVDLGIWLSTPSEDFPPPKSVDELPSCESRRPRDDEPQPPRDPLPVVQFLRGDPDAGAGCQRDGQPPPQGPADPPAAIKWLRGDRDAGCEPKREPPAPGRPDEAATETPPPPEKQP